MKWIFLAVGGLLLNGAGLSLFRDAVLRKRAAPEGWGTWFWEGRFSLALINAEVCWVGEVGLTKRKSGGNN